MTVPDAPAVVEAGGDKPIVGALLPYYGGKRTLAPRIVAELGRHRAYWEPFMGSLAVLDAERYEPETTR